MGEPALRVLVKRIDPRAVLPRYARLLDGGLDLASIEDAKIEPGGRCAVGTGIAIELPAGTIGLVLPRSGRALAEGLTLANAPGLIDAGYRGEVRVALVNLGREIVSVHAGDRIAQLVVLAAPRVEVIEVAELSVTERGEGGFGHTGRGAL
jgi:dUTP pyrophosphatase